MNEQKPLEISWGTIFKVALAFFVFYLIYLVKDILVLSVFGLIISILFEIPIRFLERKIPRTLAVVFLYVLAFAFISFLIYLPAAKLVKEIRSFINYFPVYFERIAPPLRDLGFTAFEDIESFVDMLEQTVQLMTANIFNVLFSIFGGVMVTIFVISIAIFISLEGGGMEKNLALLFPKKDEEFLTSLWQRCQKTVGLWFSVSILSCLFVGILSFITFSILKIDYPLSLSIIAGALNFVPVIGSIFAGIFIFIILAVDSLTTGFLGLILFTIIQQIDNSILTPLITKKLIKLSPVLVLISLTVGGKLFGFWGAVLTVPLVAVIVEFSRGFLERKRELEVPA